MRPRSPRKPPPVLKQTVDAYGNEPSDWNTRGGFYGGMGRDRGIGIRQKMGRERNSSMVRLPQDITAGFSKPVTPA